MVAYAPAPSVDRSSPANRVTILLNNLERGDVSAARELMPLVYDELRARAGRLMASQPRSHTLQRTALVHEAFLRLVRPGASFESRLHFFNAAAMAMRRILIDHATAKGAIKRGGAKARLSIDDVDVASEESGIDMLALDTALKDLQTISPRQHQVVMLRFFACLKDAEIAEMLGVSEKTVRRDWVTARVWLHTQMSDEAMDESTQSDSDE